jgi:hypothetical protein
MWDPVATSRTYLPATAWAALIRPAVETLPRKPGSFCLRVILIRQGQYALTFATAFAVSNLGAKGEHEK